MLIFSITVTTKNWRHPQRKTTVGPTVLNYLKYVREVLNYRKKPLRVDHQLEVNGVLKKMSDYERLSTHMVPRIGGKLRVCWDQHGAMCNAYIVGTKSYDLDYKKDPGVQKKTESYAMLY